MLCQSFIRFQCMRVVMQNSHDEQQYDKHTSRQAGYTKRQDNIDWCME